MAIEMTFEEAYNQIEAARAADVEIQTMLLWAQHDAAQTRDVPSDLCPDDGYTMTFCGLTRDGRERWRCAECGTEVVR